MRVEVGGVGIEYEVRGQGRPVVLIHGFPDSGRLWRHQVPALVKRHVAEPGSDRLRELMGRAEGCSRHGITAFMPLPAPKA